MEGFFLEGPKTVSTWLFQLWDIGTMIIATTIKQKHGLVRGQLTSLHTSCNKCQHWDTPKFNHFFVYLKQILKLFNLSCWVSLFHLKSRKLWGNIFQIKPKWAVASWQSLFSRISIRLGIESIFMYTKLYIYQLIWESLVRALCEDNSQTSYSNVTKGTLPQWKESFSKHLWFAFVVVFLAEMGRIPCCGRPESSSSNIW